MVYGKRCRVRLLRLARDNVTPGIAGLAHDPAGGRVDHVYNGRPHGGGTDAGRGGNAVSSIAPSARNEFGRTREPYKRSDTMDTLRRSRIRSGVAVIEPEIRMTVAGSHRGLRMGNGHNEEG